MTAILNRLTSNDHSPGNGYCVNGYAVRSAYRAPASKNHMLAALPLQEWERLAPQMRYGRLHAGTTLHEEGVPLRNVYFLESGIASLQLSSRNGICIEVGMVGPEGLIGIEASGSNVSVARAVVCADATAWQLPASAFAEAIRISAPLHSMALAHWQCLTMQAARLALCNQLHSIEQRLCRWLLAVRDRMDSDELPFTQEFLAQMLGVQRTGVTLAACALREAGLIHYTRGRISLRDVAGLQKLACECHATLKVHPHQIAGAIAR